MEEMCKASDVRNQELLAQKYHLSNALDKLSTDLKLNTYQLVQAHQDIQLLEAQLLQIAQVSTCVCVCVCVCVCMCLGACVGACVCVYAFFTSRPDSVCGMYVCMYVCMYVYEGTSAGNDGALMTCSVHHALAALVISIHTSALVISIHTYIHIYIECFTECFTKVCGCAGSWR
jgi:hypothetical protein